MSYSLILLLFQCRFLIFHISVTFLVSSFILKVIFRVFSTYKIRELFVFPLCFKTKTKTTEYLHFSSVYWLNLNLNNKITNNIYERMTHTLNSNSGDHLKWERASWKKSLRINLFATIILITTTVRHQTIILNFDSFSNTKYIYISTDDERRFLVVIVTFTSVLWISLFITHPSYNCSWVLILCLPHYSSTSSSALYFWFLEFLMRWFLLLYKSMQKKYSKFLADLHKKVFYYTYK
jgi:hypothetical protein